MRVISHFLIILYFVNNILRNKKSSSFYDIKKDPSTRLKGSLKGLRNSGMEIYIIILSYLFLLSTRGLSSGDVNVCRSRLR